MRPAGGSPHTFEEHWRAPYIASQATIMDLVELYFEIVYPIFPLFHQPSFIRRVSRAEYMHDRTLFMVTMAVCALVSARVRDGAVFNLRWHVASLQETESHLFYASSAKEACKEIVTADLNLLRTHAILALSAIQDGRIRDMHQHLGRYHTQMAMDGLHDENNWPSGITLVETEERRRTFWSIYTLDVFTSIVWGGVIRSRESQSNVQYPTEVDDDAFDEDGFTNVPPVLSASPTTWSTADNANAIATSWLAGRTFIIDLYRVIEHVLMRLPSRSKTVRRELFIYKNLEDHAPLSRDFVQSSVMQAYASLPILLKEIKPVTCKPKVDRFSFQSADNIATLQLLRMVLLSATGASVSERCQIANEVVNAFISIPTAYLQAISVPLLFHISVIGQILGTALEQPLNPSDYSSIREVMFTMVQLLANLEGLHMSKGATQRLRDQIARIDEFMESQQHSGGSQHTENDTMSHFSNRVGQEEVHDPRYSAYGSVAIDEALAPSPFQLPPDLLGDFSQIFDFSQMAQGWDSQRYSNPQAVSASI